MEIKTFCPGRDISGALKRAEDEVARLSILAAEEDKNKRIANERAAAIQEAARKRAQDEAEATARKQSIMERASSLVLPQAVTSAHPTNYDGTPLLNINHITDQYDATVIGVAPVYRLMNDGQLIASDNVILQDTWRIESQPMPESHIARAALLYAAWLSNRVDSLAAKAAAIASRREISGASVIYVAKLPSIQAAKLQPTTSCPQVVIKGCLWPLRC